MPDNPDLSLASMGIYAFRWRFLRELLLEDMHNLESSHDFGKDLIPHVVRNGKAVAHRLSDSCVMSGSEKEPYWRDVGTIDAFWQANIDLTEFVPALDLYHQEWPIWTYGELVPPAKFIHDEGDRRGSAVSSLVSGGCIISGTNIRESLLFTNCHTRSYAELQRVVALPGVVVNRHARISDTVIDRGVEIPAGMVVGEDPEEDARWFRRTGNGICLITRPMVDRWLAAR